MLFFFLLLYGMKQLLSVQLSLPLMTFLLLTFLDYLDSAPVTITGNSSADFSQHLLTASYTQGKAKQAKERPLLIKLRESTTRHR